MKVKEYFESLKALIEESPEILEYELIYSSDEDGSTYRKAFYHPSRVEMREVKGLLEIVEDGENYNTLCLN